MHRLLALFLAFALLAPLPAAFAQQAEPAPAPAAAADPTASLVEKLDAIKAVYYQWRIATCVYNTPALHRKIGEKLVATEDEQMTDGAKRVFYEYIRSLRPQSNEEVNEWLTTKLPIFVKGLFERLANNFALKLESINGELALEIFLAVDRGEDPKIARMVDYLKAQKGVDGTAFTGTLFVLETKIRFESVNGQAESRPRLAKLANEIGALHKAFSRIDTFPHDKKTVNDIARMDNVALWKWLAEAILVETADTPSKLEWQHMIELNKATVADLMNIPGVSAKVAQAIVDYRTKNGQFVSVNELNRVKGIGLKTLRRIKTCAYVADFRYPVKDTTVLCFFNGDNDLELSSMLGINTFEKVGTTDNMNIVCQIDRVGQKHMEKDPGADAWLDGNWTTARRYLITKDDVPFQLGSILMEKLGEVDMGSEESLLDFVRWGVHHFPARKYVLIICNHGSEFGIGGVSFDDESGNHFDTIQLGQALRKANEIFRKSTGQERFAAIIFDCCLLGKAEVMAEIREVAQAAFACENVQITWYDYDKFFDFVTKNPAATGQEIAKAFHAAYCASMRGGKMVLTASAYDLERFDVFYEPFKEFAKELVGFLGRSPEPVKAALAKLTPIKETTHFDLINFVRHLKAQAKGDAAMASACDALLAAWGKPENVETELVPQIYPAGKFQIAEAHNALEPTAHGLAIQFNDLFTWRAIARQHSQGKVMTDEWIQGWTHKKFQSGKYGQLRIARETAWHDFLLKSADLTAPPRAKRGAKKAARPAEAPAAE